jgi:penicillin amidase
MSDILSTVAPVFSHIAGLASAGVYSLGLRPAEQTKGRVTVRGVGRPVEVLRDRWGVPHVYAGSVADALFAQGFVHAQDRLWQMDFFRRLAGGRLSEIVGRRTVPLDRWTRILGLRRAAEQEVELLAPDTRELLDAYSAGVNARIGLGRLPVEFRLLRYRPEPWTPADSLSWSKMMAWWLSVNWSGEVLRARLVARLGPELAAELQPRCPAFDPPLWTGMEGGPFDDLDPSRPRGASPSTFPGAPGGAGSNNWVVSGERSASGAPLLANDMHLAMTVPSVWYENHLTAGDLDVAGVSFPGIPFVVAGHNRHLAWGFTAGLVDVQDLYVEHLRRLGDGRVEQEYDGGWHPAQVIRESIAVKGGEAVTEEVVVTRHGPVINELAPDFIGEAPLALRWTALEPEQMFPALLAMNQARDCKEFREALRLWATPAQNVVYADTAGNIAHTLAGRVPLRANGDGRVPVPGWTNDHEWIGYVPFEELPHRWNPPEGHIATANQRIWDEGRPHGPGWDQCGNHRAERIDELLQGREKVDVAWFRRMQFDQVSPHARAVAVAIARLETDDAELRRVIARLRAWDGDLAADSAEAAVCQEFHRTLTTMLLSDRLGELAAPYLGEGPVPVLAGLSVFGEHAMEWLEKTLADPGSHWFHLGAGASGEAGMLMALRTAVDGLKDRFGPDIDDWSWGALHLITFSHALGQVKPLDRLLNRGPFPAGGDFTTIWATGTSYHDPSVQAVSSGPPFRFIADLSDLDHCLGLLCPGQSGHPASRHYDDQLQAWFRQGYHPMLFNRREILEQAEAVLRLEPLRVPGEGHMLGSSSLGG